MYCTHCGVRNDVDALFCKYCGRSMSETSAGTVSPYISVSAVAAKPGRRNNRFLITLLPVLLIAAFAVLGLLLIGRWAPPQKFYSLYNIVTELDRFPGQFLRLSPEEVVFDETYSYGSVHQLTDPTVLLSVYVNGENAEWTEETLALAQENFALSLDWLEAQSDLYGHECEIYAGSEDLVRIYDAPFRLERGKEAFGASGIDVRIDDFVEEWNLEGIRDAYGVESIGILFFLPVDGVSCTMVHYLEDGEDRYWEYCNIYLYDAYTGEDAYETASVYAHEILHLFGAPDLYEGSEDEDDRATTQVIGYMREVYPTDIMYNTYDENGENVYGEIPFTISPVTAYMLGLTESCEELGIYPELMTEYPGAFYYGTG